MLLAEYLVDVPAIYEHCPDELIRKLQDATERLKESDDGSGAQCTIMEKKPSKIAEKVLEIITELLDHPEAHSLFKDNYPIKFLFLDAVASLLKLNYREDFLQKCFLSLEILFSIEYDDVLFKFHKPNLKSIYGQILADQIPHLTDLALSESFYSADVGLNDYSVFQAPFLRLVVLILKTVTLRTLLAKGFKTKHLQFLIIHFTSAPQIPDILQAIAESLAIVNNGQFEIPQAKEKVPFEILVPNQVTLYTIAMNSHSLMLKLHMASNLQLRTIINFSQFLADYGDQFQFQAGGITPSISRVTYKLIKELAENLRIEAEPQGRCLRYGSINAYAKIIEIHFDNLNWECKLKAKTALMGSIKKILYRVSLPGALRKLSKTENLTRDLCFFIFAKLIESSPETFFRHHLSRTSSKLNFESAWIGAIENHNEAACSAFIKVASSKEITDVSEFTTKVLSTVGSNLKLKKNTYAHLSQDLRILVAIAEFHSKVHRFCLFTQINKQLYKIKIVKVIDLAFVKLNELLDDEEYLEMYLQFMVQIIKVTSTTYSFRDHVLQAVEIFDRIANSGYQFKIKEKTYRLCLELIGLIVEHFRSDSFLKEYRLTFLELLFEIEANCDDGVVNKQVEKLLPEFEPKKAMRSQKKK